MYTRAVVTPTFQYDSSSVDGEPRERQPASAAIRAMRADIKTYTEVRHSVSGMLHTNNIPIRGRYVPRT